MNGVKKRKVSPKQVETLPLKKKKQKSESDESDFVMDAADEGKASDDEAGDANGGEDSAGEGAEASDDLESDGGDDAGEFTFGGLLCAECCTVGRPPKKNPGWGGKGQTVKKAPIKLLV